MTKLEQDILNFELFQISVFLDELNEMLKKDMIILLKLKHKRYRAKVAGGVMNTQRKQNGLQDEAMTNVVTPMAVKICKVLQELNKGGKNPSQPLSPKLWFYLPPNSWGYFN